MEENKNTLKYDLRVMQAIRDLQDAMRVSGLGPDGSMYAYEIDGTAAVIMQAVYTLVALREKNKEERNEVQ